LLSRVRVSGVDGKALLVFFLVILLMDGEIG
jgi:hypothetical protein